MLFKASPAISYTMKCLILLSLVSLAFASQRTCGENQRYLECGTACPLTCENYASPPKFCPAVCVSGCHCEKGYVKTEDGRCVRPEECPARTADLTCGENQRYLECGTACPLTCENYANPPKICPAMCVIGCHCEEGYVKTEDRRCVRPEECPARLLSKNVCDLPAEAGLCDAYMPRFYFDRETRDCRRFVYGGCGGNANNFHTLEECRKSCAARLSSKNVCDLPAEAGLCDAYMPRFYFDRATGDCKRFVYGGCGGNANNFRTLEECRKICA